MTIHISEVAYNRLKVCATGLPAELTVLPELGCFHTVSLAECVQYFEKLRRLMRCISNHNLRWLHLIAPKD